MSDCKHEAFRGNCMVKRLSDVEGGPITSYSVDVTITCEQCLTPFKFLGLGVGSSPTQPMTDVPGTELRAPIVPVGEQHLVGKLGFSISPRMAQPAPGFTS